MNNEEQNENKSSQKLVDWLKELLITNSTEAPNLSNTTEQQSATHLLHEPSISLELLWQNDTYHQRFYQQLPDFVEALLKQDPFASSRYAALLTHLAGCNVCFQSYLEIYEAMHDAFYPEGSRPMFGQSTHTTPDRILAQLCQAWITQAEAILYDARERGVDENKAVRTLLHSVIHISGSIRQEGVRQQARKGLVQVATLFDVASTTQTEPTYSFSPVLTSSKGVKRRGTGNTSKPDSSGEQLVLDLHDKGLTGSIVKQGDMLELRLHNLETSLRGQHIVASIALGSLIEPIRWFGGNPWAIHSSTPVDMTGALVMPLGETDLQPSVPDDHNMLETTFMQIEIRKSA